MLAPIGFATRVPFDLDSDDPRGDLERGDHQIRTLFRENKGGADHRMAGNAISAVRLKIRTRAVFCRIGWGQEECRLTKIEFGSQGLHRLVIERLGPMTTAKGLPPKRVFVNTSTV